MEEHEVDPMEYHGAELDSKKVHRMEQPQVE